jgi:hypothetical protein
MSSCRLSITYCSLALLLLGACNRKATPTKSGAGPGTSAVVPKSQSIEPTLPEVKPINTTFEFLSAKGKVAFEVKNDKKNANLSVRVRRDNSIWLSASLVGIEGARVLLTPDSVRVINRIDNTYFAGGYDYFSKLLNVPLSFADVQALLLGDYLPAPAGSKPTLQAADAGRQRVQYPQAGVVVQRLLDISSGRVQQLKISDEGAKRNLTVDYVDFKPLEGQEALPFANNIAVQAKQPAGATTATIIYSKVSVSREPLEFPFEVPKGYKRKK